MMQQTRSAQVERKTRETEISVALDLDPAAGAVSAIDTGVGFFDHMLDALATHGRLGLRVKARGDLHIDQHHLVEDTGIVLGQALSKALGDDRRIVRFADAYAPLDDALARAVIDVSGRAYLHYGATLSRPIVGAFDTDLAREFFQAFVANARINLHLDLIRGGNAHHELESMFKATALALRAAVQRDASLAGVPSTKGTLTESAAEDNARTQGGSA